MFGLVCICRFKIRTLGGIFQAVRRKETNNCLLLMLTQHHNYGDDQPIRVSIFPQDLAQWSGGHTPAWGRWAWWGF